MPQVENTKPPSFDPHGGQGPTATDAEPGRIRWWGRWDVVGAAHRPPVVRERVERHSTRRSTASRASSAEARRLQHAVLLGAHRRRTVVTAFQRVLDANTTDVHVGEHDRGRPSPQPVATGTSPRVGLGARRGAAGRGCRSDQVRVQFDPPTAYGAQPTTGFSRWTRSTRRRATSSSQNSTSASTGASASLQVTRMYNSLDERVGLFGPGWASGVRDPARTRRRGRVVRRRRRPAQVPVSRDGEGWARGRRREPVARGRGRRTGRQRQRRRPHHLHTCSGSWTGSASGPGHGGQCPAGHTT